MAFWHDPGSVFAFKKGRSELSVEYRPGSSCNLCHLRYYVFKHNREIITPDLEINWAAKNVDQEISSDTSEESSSIDLDSWFYTDGSKEMDICSICINRYPVAEDLIGATIFYFMIYDYTHYYPNFPEMRFRIVKQNQINPLQIDIHQLTYQGFQILSLIPGYNNMLELMDLFGLSLNQMLEIFIDRLDEREQNFITLGLGTKFLSPPRVIYKFFEKFARYTVRYRLKRSSDQHQKWTDEQIWKVKDVNFDLEWFKLDLGFGGFLSKHSYQESVDRQTYRLLRRFLDLYDKDQGYLDYQYIDQEEEGLNTQYWSRENIDDQAYLWALNKYCLSLVPVMSSDLQNDIISTAEEFSLRPGNWAYLETKNSFNQKIFGR